MDEAAYLDLVIEMTCRFDDRKGFAGGEITAFRAKDTAITVTPMNDVVIRISLPIAPRRDGG